MLQFRQRILHIEFRGCKQKCRELVYWPGKFPEMVEMLAGDVNQDGK